MLVLLDPFTFNCWCSFTSFSCTSINVKLSCFILLRHHFTSWARGMQVRNLNCDILLYFSLVHLTSFLQILYSLPFFSKEGKLQYSSLTNTFRCSLAAKYIFVCSQKEDDLGSIIYMRCTYYMYVRCLFLRLFAEN